MSKKGLLLCKKYYNKDSENSFSDSQKFNISLPQKSFSDVIKNLIKRKYLCLTDTGYLHLLPKGVFMQDAIAYKAKKIMELDGAIRYRFAPVFSSEADAATQSLTKKFEDQIFKISANDGKVGYLKYASDPLIFQYFSGREINTPLKIYSPDYFFRAIKAGELKPLIQPREFYMTDFHYFYELDDFDAYAKAALLNKKALELFIGDGEWYLNIDTNIDFFNSHKERILKMLDDMMVNAVINITSEKSHYYSIQNQYIVDYFFGNKTQLANLQFDQKNGGLFNILYSTTKATVSIIHGTMFGRTEKVMALVFGKQVEQSYKEKEYRPVLPIWLSPIAVRVIPVDFSKKVLEFSENLGRKLSKIQCRYDIDYRVGVSLNKKIKDGEQDWIPFQVVLGEEELKSKIFSVRDRYMNRIYTTTTDKFIKDIAHILSKDDRQNQTTSHIFMGDDIY